MSGYTYKATPPATLIPEGGIRLLTAREFQALPEKGKAARRAHWQGIIRGLQLEHERTYHAHTPGDLRTTCSLDGCNRPLSRKGLCERDYMRQYRAQKRGEAA
jgi:hypothetical protein